MDVGSGIAAESLPWNVFGATLELIDLEIHREVLSWRDTTLIEILSTIVDALTANTLASEILHTDVVGIEKIGREVLASDVVEHQGRFDRLSAETDRLSFGSGATATEESLLFANSVAAVEAAETDVALSQPAEQGVNNILETAFSFPDFSDTSDLQLNGATTQNGSRLSLTPDWDYQIGSAYFATPIEVDDLTSFQTQFQFQLPGSFYGTNGASGFTFLLQNSDRGVEALGNFGRDLGYSDIDASLAIEFDTFDSEGFSDPNNNHVSILQNGDPASALATAGDGLPDFNSGELLNAWIEYDGNSDRLDIFVSDSSTQPSSPILTQTVDLASVVGSQAYVGFTAATGRRFNEHAIANWSFQAETVPDSLFALADSETILTPEGAGVATITAVRTGDIQQPATLEYTTNEVGEAGATAEIDYTTPTLDDRGNTGEITFDIGEAEKSFEIPIVDDGRLEDNETFAVGIQNPSVGSLGAPRTVLVEIVDDDSSSSISVSEVDITVAEGDFNASVVVQRSGNIDGTATVDFTTNPGTAIAGEDFTATSGTLTFAAGETTQILTVPILRDANLESIETFSVELSNAVGSALGEQTLSTIEILDNDLAFGPLNRQTVIADLEAPTTLEWTPDGRFMLIAQKNGIVRLAENGNVQSTPVIDLSEQVNDTGDRGLLGLAIHPDFPATPYLYLLHTYDPPETAGQTGLAGPDGGGNRPSRLVRVDIDPNTAIANPDSLTVLAGTNSIWEYTSQPDGDSTGDPDILPSGIANGTTITAPADQIELGVQDNDPDRPGIQNENIRDYLATDSESHSIGDLHFGPDGFLYYSNGDGTSYNFVDPRTVRVQDVSNLSGKVLRVDPITGEGVASNPFFDGDPGSNQSKVYYSGMRNPFRFTFDPVTGLPVIGDVGWNSWEEINTGVPGSNFGWPYLEGPERPGGYSDLEQAIAFYDNGNVNPNSPSLFPAVAATISRSHGAPDFANAIAVGDFYDDNTLVFGDINSGTIYAATLDDDRAISNLQVLDSEVPFVVDIEVGPDGYLYGTSLFSGTIERWEPA